MRIITGLWIAALALCGRADLRAEAGAPGKTDYSSPYYALGFSRGAAGFSRLVVDGIGKGKLEGNPVLEPAATSATLRFRAVAPGRFEYVADGAGGQSVKVWEIECAEKQFSLTSHYAPEAPPPGLTLTFDQKANHATLLGLMQPGVRRMPLPCVLHMPDMGSFRITGPAGASLDYDARRRVKPAFVRVAFPPATAQQPRVTYRLESAAIYPPLNGIENDPMYDGYKRGYLNMFQVNPRVQMLANNASSDPVAFSVYQYAEMALPSPALASGVTCLDLVRMTLDRYLAGAKGYGIKGYPDPDSDADLIPWGSPWNALDTYPSLLIAAGYYVSATGGKGWADANYARLAEWGRAMMTQDRDGNGLIEYPGSGNYGDRPTSQRRPSNWWDTINFGHEDAYANALAHEACRCLSTIASELGRREDHEFFQAKANKLYEAYVKTFLNPETGVLAGWRSADGKLHDYWFTFVNGVAIHYGLVPPGRANDIMDRMLAKMKEVGYTRFDLGLPGNLVPVKKGDYVDANTPPQVHGVPQKEDGSDGFQYYENGGATGCYAYFTISALYKLGRAEDARGIFYPMLKGYAAGNFQGFGDNGMSRDWRDWQGGCHGYEGLLVENYLALKGGFEEMKGKMHFPQ